MLPQVILDFRLVKVGTRKFSNLQSTIKNLKFQQFVFSEVLISLWRLGSLQQLGSLKALSLDFGFDDCMGWFCQIGVLFH
jgi:hypothetical protein